MVKTRFKRHDLIKGAGKGREAYKGGRDGLDDAPGVRAYPGNAALVLFGLVLEALRLLGVVAVTAVPRMRAAATTATTRPLLGASATRRGLSSGTVYSTAMMHYDTWMWVVCLRLGYVWLRAPRSSLVSRSTRLHAK